MVPRATLLGGVVILALLAANVHMHQQRTAAVTAAATLRDWSVDQGGAGRLEASNGAAEQRAREPLGSALMQQDPPSAVRRERDPAVQLPLLPPPPPPPAPAAAAAAPAVPAPPPADNGCPPGMQSATDPALADDPSSSCTKRHVFANGVAACWDHVRIQQGRYSKVNLHEPSEEELLARALKLIRPNDVFVDVGAAVGYYTLLVASTHSEAKVYGFNPSGWFRKQMAHNIRINFGGKSGPPTGAPICIEPRALGLSDGAFAYVLDAVCCVYTCRRLIDLSPIAGTLTVSLAGGSRRRRWSGAGGTWVLRKASGT